METNSKVKNLLIGLFVALAIIIVVWFLLFFRPHYGDRGETLKVRFSSIANIDVGTPVTFAGQIVGQVDKISRIYNAREAPSDSLGHPYFFELTLLVDSSVKIYSTDLIEIQTSGLLGEKSIAIVPQKAPAGAHPKLMNDHVIYADSTDPLSSTLISVDTAAKKIGLVVDSIGQLINENKGNIDSIMISLKRSMQQVDLIITDINRLHLVETFHKAADTGVVLMANINSYIDEVRDSHLLQKFSQTAGNIQLITKRIVNGQGTIGKLVNDPTLYLQAVGTLDRVDTLISDMNQYGVFYNLDKKWKRVHQKRINEMEALKTPREFKTYFENELDEVSNSLSRISILVEKSQEEKVKIEGDKEFKQAFLDLLQQVRQLQNLVELYNQKLTEE